MTRFSLWLAIVAGTLSSACALGPPVRNSGPVASKEGLRLAVLEQRCEQIVEPDWPDDDLVELIVELQLHNPTRDAATVKRVDFRLLDGEGGAIETSTWGAIDPVTVEPASDRTFKLRFMTRGGLACAKEMRLDPRAGVVVNKQPVQLGVVSFVPWPA